ncbi:MAG: type II toxin-antitoxin system RelE/ParE family toxin [Clostridiales bacterium]|nr:type II toxin-antitoxin system RelE/ParE family toxin [Clostridiales bacterium]
MKTVKQTDVFKDWLSGLKDNIARAVINARIRRLSAGNKGDTKYVGNGVSELRVDHGPGYRVYYFQAEQEIIILLCGGDKSSQNKDIKRAKQLILLLEVTK